MSRKLALATLTARDCLLRPWAVAQMVRQKCAQWADMVAEFNAQIERMLAGQAAMEADVRALVAECERLQAAQRAQLQTYVTKGGPYGSWN